MKGFFDVYMESYVVVKIFISDWFCLRLLFFEEFNFDEIFVDLFDNVSSLDED